MSKTKNDNARLGVTSDGQAVTRNYDLGLDTHGYAHAALDDILNQARALPGRLSNVRIGFYRNPLTGPHVHATAQIKVDLHAQRGPEPRPAINPPFCDRCGSSTHDSSDCPAYPVARVAE